MNSYKVLWFDDECNQLEEIEEEARDFDIELEGVTNAKDGLGILNSSSFKFDAVLLDGMFFSDVENSEGEESDNAFGMVVKNLTKRVDTNDFLPWFILSGQPSFVKDKNKLVELFREDALPWSGDKVFDKNNDDDTQELFKKMVEAIENTESYKIKAKYAEVFDVTASGALPIEEESRIIQVARNIQLNNVKENVIDLFNPLRKIMEVVHQELINTGVVAPGVTLNALPYFLSNMDRNYPLNGEITPPVIGHLIKGVIPIVQEGSHSKLDMKMKLKDYCQETNNTFLYNICALQVFEILIWFKKYIEEHPNKEENEKLWSSQNTLNDQDHSEKNESLSNALINSNGSWIAGKVLEIQNTGYGTFKPDDFEGTITLIPDHVKEYNLKTGDKLKVSTKPSPDGKKPHIKSIQKN